MCGNVLDVPKKCCLGKVQNHESEEVIFRHKRLLIVALTSKLNKAAILPKNHFPRKVFHDFVISNI